MMVTAVLVLLLLFLAMNAQVNLAALHAPVPFRVVGMDGLPISYARMLVGIGGLLMLLWAAGLLDLAVMGGRLRRRDALMRAKNLEIAQLKAAAYDRQQVSLDDIRMQVKGLDQELIRVLDRLETVSLRKDRVVIRGPATPITHGEERVVRGEVVQHPSVTVEDRTTREDASAPGARKVRRWFFPR